MLAPVPPSSANRFPAPLVSPVPIYSRENSYTISCILHDTAKAPQRVTHLQLLRLSRNINVIISII